jgi:hypothetical protein
LKRTYNACEEWASRYKSLFNPKKYELMHFTRTPKRFNLKTGIQIAGIELKPKNQVKVLEIQLDPALQ